jgi:hypothetical protein
MNETTPSTTPATTTPIAGTTTAAAVLTDADRQAVLKLISEAGDDIPLIKQAVAAIKAKDKAALAALLPQIALEVKEDVAAVEAALPAIKAGFKTTEFWAVVVLAIANVALVAFGKQPLPWDINAVLGAVTVAYGFFRTLLKGKSMS